MNLLGLVLNSFLLHFLYNFSASYFDYISVQFFFILSAWKIYSQNVKYLQKKWSSFAVQKTCKKSKLAWYGLIMCGLLQAKTTLMNNLQNNFTIWETIYFWNVTYFLVAGVVGWVDIQLHWVSIVSFLLHWIIVGIYIVNCT